MVKEKYKILIVEDSTELAAKIQKKLEKFGYDIVGMATNGQDAVFSAFSTNPDLILMDIILNSQMDGITAAKRISVRRDIPIIFLTAHYDDDFLERAEEIAPYGYLLKPFREKELIIAIKMALIKHNKQKEKHDRIKKKFYDLFSRKLIPVCAKCKSIRDISGNWHKIEDYFKLVSNVKLSHSICPECSKKIYSEYENQSIKR